MMNFLMPTRPDFLFDFQKPNKTTYIDHFHSVFLVMWCPSKPIMIGLVNKPSILSYICSNLG